DGMFTDHHGRLVGMHLDRIDVLDTHIGAMTTMIDELVGANDLGWARDLLATIPGLSINGAENILAETGVDISAFDSSAHLAPWAVGCAGQHESAGKSSSGKTRPGNAHLKGALGIAAMAAIRTNGSFFQDRHRRLAARRGGMRALVAIEHS